MEINVFRLYQNGTSECTKMVQVSRKKVTYMYQNGTSKKEVEKGCKP